VELQGEVSGSQIGFVNFVLDVVRDILPPQRAYEVGETYEQVDKHDDVENVGEELSHESVFVRVPQEDELGHARGDRFVADCVEDRALGEYVELGEVQVGLAELGLAGVDGCLAPYELDLDRDREEHHPALHDREVTYHPQLEGVAAAARGKVGGGGRKRCEGRLTFFVHEIE